MKRWLLSMVLVLVCPALSAETTIAVELHGAALRGERLHLKVIVDGTKDESLPAEVFLDGTRVAAVELTPGEQVVVLDDVKPGSGKHTVRIIVGGVAGETTMATVPGWLSVLPPLLAIALALIFKDVLISLLLGVFAGALILFDWNPLTAFARTIDHFVSPALSDPDHAKIIVFSTLLGGMVGLIGKIGGTQGIVERLKGWATTARRGQVATWLMGLFIFFDDYANTLIVGSTMRPITDRLRISREKLAYIVDSTAAPVSSVFPISTWIGFEVGLIAAAFTSLQIPFDPYLIFIQSIPFRFYPIFCLVLGFTIAFSCRDLGPMLEAELRASHTGKLMADDAVPLADYSSSALAPPAGTPLRAINAVLPILTVVGVTVGGLWVSGAASVSRADYPDLTKYVQGVLSNANSYDSLLWASLAGVVMALVLGIVQRLVPLRESMSAMVEGFKSMVLAMIVLVLAWSIGSVTGELHTADFVVGLAKDVISPHWLGALTFALAAVISFATGTSWGTMAILMPIIIPVTHGLSLGAGHAVGTESYHLFMLSVISSVLAGSVWGDHCSPISDTTILSSMATGSDHIAHVRTQLPYALGIGILGMFVGDIPTGFGMSPWISLPIGTVLIVVIVLVFGKRSDWRPNELTSPARSA